MLRSPSCGGVARSFSKKLHTAVLVFYVSAPVCSRTVDGQPLRRLAATKDQSKSLATVGRRATITGSAGGPTAAEESRRRGSESGATKMIMHHHHRACSSTIDPAAPVCLLCVLCVRRGCVRVSTTDWLPLGQNCKLHPIHQSSRSTIPVLFCVGLHMV